MFYDRPKPGSWQIDKAEIDQSMQVIQKDLPVDRTHDVPYVAGYSTDGDELFIDRRMPKTITYRGRKVDVTKYIVLHEAVEKALIKYLKLAYLHAHQIAMRAERSAVEADGLNWHDYNAAIDVEVKKIGDRKVYPCCPKNLDLKPYKDERDKATLNKMEYD
jgi:hypothetical protein